MNPVATTAPGPVRRWVLAARVRTLPAAIVPVVVGAAAVRPTTINWGNSVLCAVVALSLQIATNYANDYSDGIRGTDEVRVGPFRLTASGLVPSRAVRNAAFAMFAAAAAAGVVLAARTSWWLIAVGITAIAAGWFYTGGPKPYGYYGFGELFVFVYFGLVATVGTSYVQHGTIPSRSWLLATAMGAASCTLLEANNLRDVDGDRAAGKRTLAARLGRERASWLYAIFAVIVAGASGAGAMGVRGELTPVLLYGLGIYALYFYPMTFAFSSRRGRELLPLLAFSARLQLVVGAVLTVTVWLIY
jgi:1,4-dihydroxy-2-naphthoate octaprenyltransferase